MSADWFMIRRVFLIRGALSLLVMNQSSMITSCWWLTFQITLKLIRWRIQCSHHKGNQECECLHIQKIRKNSLNCRHKKTRKNSLNCRHKDLIVVYYENDIIWLLWNCNFIQKNHTIIKKCKSIRIHNYWVSLTKLKDWAFKPRLFLLADKYGSTICISAKFQQGSCHM
jgi:hypothetical protein